MVDVLVFILGSCVGLLARWAILKPEIQSWAAQRVELAVPSNSWRRVEEGVFLQGIGVDPYSGDIFHETPFCLLLFSRLKLLSEISVSLFFPLCDLIAAIMLFYFAKNFIQQTIIRERLEKTRKDHDLWIGFDSITTVPRLVFLCYLCNPFVIGSCLAKSTSVLTNLLLAAMLFFASQGPRFWNRCISILFLSFASYQTLYMVLLFPALHLYFRQQNATQPRPDRKSAIAPICVDLFLFVGFLAAILWASSYAMESWSFIRGVYGFLIYSPDLTPNIGLFWYFFTEMFEQFRTFFTWIFFMNVCIYSVPVAVKLRHDPAFAIFILLPIITVFKPYPSYGDVGFYLSLFPIWKHLISQMRQTLVVSVMMSVAAVLFPVLWKLWIEVGSANANFFYAITLVFAASQVFFVSDVLVAHEKREWYIKNNAESVDENGVRLELNLQ